MAWLLAKSVSGPRPRQRQAVRSVDSRLFAKPVRGSGSGLGSAGLSVSWTVTPGCSVCLRPEA
eukprot:761019-Rhodomonas_salina.1